MPGSRTEMGARSANEADTCRKAVRPKFKAARWNEADVR